ncbi:MAG TPA: helix-turn-helix transcriptional regulator [Terracidiphilus sp.]|nr:helix-turn-helix transcriptional regulator [Terracidiphilus sp.]
MPGQRKPKTLEENQFNQQVGALIANVRRIHRIEQAELARRLGVSKGMIYFWESGEQRIPIYRLHELARVLGVPIVSLLPGVTVPSLSARKRKIVIQSVSVTETISRG